MRSMVGVGITPPKVLGTPKPASSVMISSTLGARFGGTTRGAHQGFDCRASSLITPPNFGSGGGSCLPLMLVVALGEPSVPVTCCAEAHPDNSNPLASATTRRHCDLPHLIFFIPNSSLRPLDRVSRLATLIMRIMTAFDPDQRTDLQNC